MINEIIRDCMRKSITIKSMINCNESTLMEHIETQIKKVNDNKYISAIQKYEDIYPVAENNMRGVFCEKTIKNLLKTLEYRVINTANHFGGVYSPQSFQGDLLFCVLLERMGAAIDAVPIPATSIVPLCNCTNPRSIVLYHDSKAPFRIPLLPAKEKNSIVTSVSAYEVDRVKSLIPSIKSNPKLKSIRTELIDLLESVYCLSEISEKNNFCTQISMIEYMISAKIFNNGGPRFIYLEMERLFKELVIKDLNNKNSLLYLILFDEEVVKAMNEPDDVTGECFSWFLFKGIDSQKRIYRLTLSTQNRLVGKMRNGEEIVFPADVESIIHQLKEEKICIGTGLSAIVSFFARGMIWLGGPFQSEYLPEMQRMLSDALKKASYFELSRYVEQWKCDGYISGPIFMLSETDDGALVNAGPVECLKNPVSWRSIKELISNTTVYNGHIMGMFEFYDDFISANEKRKDWYHEIALYCQKHFQKNKI